MVQGLMSSVLGAEEVLQAEPPGALGGAVFVAATILVVVACVGALVMRYRKVSI
jgi:hypothetical protein